MQNNNYKNTLEELRENVKAEYSSIKEVFCPYFNECVAFAADGFKHIAYRRTGNTIILRDAKSQDSRLRLLKLAPKLLKITSTVQEYCINNQFVTIVHNKKKENILKPIQYWAFTAIINNKRIKVIVKQVGNGKKRFWSIIPNWITRKKDTKNKILHYYGNLEND